MLFKIVQFYQEITSSFYYFILYYYIDYFATLPQTFLLLVLQTSKLNVHY